MQQRQRSPLPPPGSRLQIEVTDISSRGLGVGRSPDGVVVMVRGAVPGDRVTAVVCTLRRSFVEADLAEVQLPSRDRVEPRCSHFGICGGCALQHLSGAAQRRLKTGRVRELLRRTAGLAGIPVDDTVPVGPDYEYRNRMEFSFAKGRDGPVLGLHRVDGPVFDLMECHLPLPVMTQWVESVRRLAHTAAGGGDLPLRRLDIRCSRASGEMLLDLSAGGPLPAPVEEALARLIGEEGGPATVTLSRGSRHRILAGRGFIRECLLGLTVPVTPGAFVQTHTAGAEAIYSAALSWLEAGAPDSFLDLYSGAGILALKAARRCRGVVAVEASGGAVAAGRRAAAENRRQVRFAHGDALTVSRGLAASGRHFEAGVVNPPRAGLHRELPGVLGHLGLARLAYISCDPGTLARDLRRLVEIGYRVERVTPFDLFPQTAEIEVLARLQGPSGSAAG
jgi:23S rRNA (uracil1939-C5)-methyltransferase